MSDIFYSPVWKNVALKVLFLLSIILQHNKSRVKIIIHDCILIELDFRSFHTNVSHVSAIWIIEKNPSSTKSIGKAKSFFVLYSSYLCGANSQFLHLS